MNKLPLPNKYNYGGFDTNEQATETLMPADHIDQSLIDMMIKELRHLKMSKMSTGKDIKPPFEWKMKTTGNLMALKKRILLFLWYLMLSVEALFGSKRSNEVFTTNEIYKALVIKKKIDKLHR